MKRLSIFFALAVLVTGCDERVTRPDVGQLSDGVTRQFQSAGGAVSPSYVSYYGVSYQVPEFVGLVDLNAKPVCKAATDVLGETLGLQVTCNASGSIWFDSGKDRTGPEVFTGFVAALRAAGITVQARKEGLVIAGDGRDTAAVVSGGPVDAPGVDFLGDGTSVAQGPALDQVSRSFGALVSVTDGGGTVISVPNVSGLIDTAQGIIADSSLDVAAFETSERLFLTGPQAQVQFLKAALEPEGKHSVTLVTGPMEGETVEALQAAYPDLSVAHDRPNGLVFVRGYGDELEAALPSLRRFVREPRQVRLDGVFAEFTQKKALDTGFTVDSDTGNVTGSFGASVDGGSLTFHGDLNATLSLLEEAGDVSVIARPSLTVLDGQSADFVSGDQVPVLGETVQDEAGRVTQSIEYRDTGIVLRAFATVLDDATVQVQVTVEVTSVQEATGVGGNPVFSTRTINTTLRVTDGQSVVISGLDQVSHSLGNRGAPFLSRFGLLGNRSSKKLNSQLIFVVTPDVMGTSGAVLRNTGNF